MRPSWGRGPGCASGDPLNEPAAVAHELAVSELVLLAPGLNPARGDAEPAEARRLARVEAAALGEVVPQLGRDLVDDRDVAVDHGYVADVAEPQSCRAAGQVAAGRALGGRGEQDCLAVPVEGQRDQVRPAVRRCARDPEVDVMREPVLGVLAALGAG